jgi:hypothetical protein
MSMRLESRLRRLEAGRAGADATLTLVLQYVSLDGTVHQERWLRYQRVGHGPTAQSDDGGRTWRAMSC